MTPPVLCDGWPDSGPEERVWVPVEDVPAGGQAALKAALADLDGYADTLEDDGLELVATGARAWMREAPCQACDGSGADPSWSSYGLTLGELDAGGALHGPDPACESCLGDGRQTGAEGYAYHACGPDDPGASCFWVLEVRERSRA